MPSKPSSDTIMEVNRDPTAEPRLAEGGPPAEQEEEPRDHFQLGKKKKKKSGVHWFDGQKGKIGKSALFSLGSRRGRACGSRLVVRGQEGTKKSLTLQRTYVPFLFMGQTECDAEKQ